MNARAINSIPQGDWAGGWCIGPSAWNQNCGPSIRGKFRTLKAPGDIAPAKIPASWSFHLGLTATPIRPQCVLLANGFRLSFNRDHRAVQISCVAVASGVLLIEANAPITPTLFAAEYDVHRGDEAEWIELPWGSVVLMHDSSENPHRYCLIAREQPHAANITAARTHLRTDPTHLIDQELVRREQILEKHHIAEARKPLVLHAIESLAGHLRPPIGSFAHRWSNADLNGNDRMDLNQVYPLVSAWCALDATVALDILTTALSRQSPSGFLPVMATPDGHLDTQHAALPLFAQAALILKRTLEEPALLEPLIPRLKNYLSWAITYYDPERDGNLTWHTSAEALIEGTFDTDVLSADLYALLLCEIDAMIELTESDTEGSTDLLAARDTLAQKLETDFWDEKASCFPDRFKGGEPVERIALSAFIPLLWSDLDDRYASPMIRKLDSTGGLRRKQGLALWTEWEDDTDPAPIPFFHQLLMIHGLQQRTDQATIRRLRQDVLKAMTAQYSNQGRIADNISNGKADAGEGPPSSTSTANAAAVCIDITCLSPTSSSGPHVSISLKWFDRHRKSVLVSVVSIFAVAVLAVIIAFILKKRPPIASIKANAALAEQYYSEGKYAQAIPVLRELLRGGTARRAVEVQLGNALMHEGSPAEAETYYRSVLSEKPHPVVALNLALALHRQGREQEAKQQYRDIIEQYANVRPDLAERATTALYLISSSKP